MRHAQCCCNAAACAGACLKTGAKLLGAVGALPGQSDVEPEGTVTLEAIRRKPGKGAQQPQGSTHSRCLTTVAANSQVQSPKVHVALPKPHAPSVPALPLPSALLNFIDIAQERPPCQ